MAEVTMYDIHTDDFRPVTQEDWDHLRRAAVCYGKFIVSKGLRDEFHAYRDTPKAPVESEAG